MRDMLRDKKILRAALQGLLPEKFLHPDSETIIPAIPTSLNPGSDYNTPFVEGR
jgi:hypothetical protein